ncbi:MAG: DNA-3-methyladenine glycosylase [Candidatus Parcubacteria bacterium]|jgi:DNA-3-methyladenine glycosylase I
MSEKVRCVWVNMKNQLYVEYHDTEWGVECHDDKKLFELLCLEGAQAGLSWETVLNKREEYKKCFYNFDVNKILKKTDEELLQQMTRYNIIKNRLKVLGVKKNALAYKKIVAEHGSLATYLWSYVDHKQVIQVWEQYKDAPTQTDISVQMSKNLKKYGFTFIGPTICYAFMQAAGMVSDHEKDCFRAK